MSFLFFVRAIGAQSTMVASPGIQRGKRKGRRFFTDADSYTFGDRWDLWGKGRISWKRVFTVAGHALRNSLRVPPAITHTIAPSSSPLKFVQTTTLLRTASSVHLVHNEITKSYTRDRGDVEEYKAYMCVPLQKNKYIYIFFILCENRVRINFKK